MNQAFIQNIGWPGFLIIGVVALVMFGGRGKIPSLMKDMGKGITAFKRGLKEEDKDEAIEDATDKAADAADTAQAKIKEKS